MDRYVRFTWRIVLATAVLALAIAGAATTRLIRGIGAGADSASAMVMVNRSVPRPAAGHSMASATTQERQVHPAVVPGTDPGYADETPPARRDRLAAAKSAGERPKGKVEQIPVLMYHEIGEVNNGNYVRRSDFEAEVKWLSDNGFHTVTLGELYHHLHDGTPLPERPVVLTFDDGYRTFYDVVVPVLKPYGFRATTFVITSALGHPEHMTWQMVAELPQLGMEIGSHTVHHLDLRTLSAAKVAGELTDSKQQLEEKAKVTVNFFCYPAGRYNSDVVAASKTAGYLAAVTTEYGPVTPDESPLLWARIRISRGESITAFASRIKRASGLE